MAAFHCCVTSPSSSTSLLNRRDGKTGKEFCERLCLLEWHRCFAQSQLKSCNSYLRGSSLPSWVRELAKPLTIGKFYEKSSLRKERKKLIYSSLPFLSLVFFLVFFFLWKVLHQLLRQTWTNLQNVMLFLFLEQRNSQSSRTPTICLYRREAYYNELINQLDI